MLDSSYTELNDPGTCLTHVTHVAQRGGVAMSFEEAIDALSRDERFKAALYAMNTLLISKGVYTQEEFERLFVEWAAKEQRTQGLAPQRAGHASLREA